MLCVASITLFALYGELIISSNGQRSNSDFYYPRLSTRVPKPIDDDFSNVKGEPIGSQRSHSGFQYPRPSTRVSKPIDDDCPNVKRKPIDSQRSNSGFHYPRTSTRVPETIDDDFTNIKRKPISSQRSNPDFQYPRPSNNRVPKPIDDDFQNIKWDPIETNWNWDVPDLSNLGDQVTKEVEGGLKSLYETEVRLDMENGRNGNTVVTFKPDGKTLIMKDGKPFECPGTISNYGVCSQNLIPFRIRKESDNCFLSTNVMVNGHVCLSSDNSVQLTGTFDDGITCRTSQGQKIEPMSLRKYEELCRSSAIEADYKYVTRNKISSHKPGDIRCTTGFNPTVCTFSVKKKLGGSGARISNVNINL